MKDIEVRSKEHFINEFGEEVGEKFFHSMVHHSKDKIEGINKAIEEKNREELIRFFHSLKGLMLQGGLNDISDIAKDLELHSKNGMDFEAIKEKKEESLKDLENFLLNH